MSATAVKEQKGKLTVSADLVDLANTKTVLESIIIAKRDELKSVSSAIMAEQVALTRIRDQKRREEAEFHGKLKAERAQFDKGLAWERQQQQQTQRGLDAIGAELEEKRKEIVRLTSRSEEIRKQHDTNTKERIELQQARIRANDISAAAQKLNEKAQQEWTNVQNRAKTLSQLETRLKVWQSQLEERQGKIEADLKAASTDLKSLKALRGELDPKLKALAEKESSIADEIKRSAAILRESQQKVTEAEQAKADLHGLAVRLNDQKEKQTQKEAELRSFEQSLSVREARLAAQGEPEAVAKRKPGRPKKI